MPKDLGKVLITGAAGGLGSALTEQCIAAGMNVEALARDELDVTSYDSIKAAFEKVGELDLLICNAGLTLDNTLIKMSELEWNQVMDVNLRGAFRCAREASRGMLKRRTGHILFISSFSAIHPPIGQANYASAKAALLGMMKCMAVELGGRNVRVNAIVPGFLETKMTENLPAKVKEDSMARHALGRFNTPQAVAQFVDCLHHQMPHTSGQIFHLDSRILYQ